MWKWLENLGRKPKKAEEPAAHKLVDDAAPQPSPENTPPPSNVVYQDVTPANATPISTGLEALRDREPVKPSDILQDVKEAATSFYKKLEDVVDKSADGPKIVNQGGVDVFVPGKPKKPIVEKFNPVPENPAPAAPPVQEAPPAPVAPETPPALVPEPVVEPAPASVPAIPEPPVAPERPKASRKAQKKAAPKKGKVKGRRAK